MAEVAKVVRDEVAALFEVETDKGPLRQLYAEIRQNLRADLTPEGFADMYAQTMVYGLLTARITHPEDFEADALNSVLKFENPFLDALYSSFRRKGDEAFDVDEFGLHDLAEILARTQIDEVLADFGAEDRKDDPVVHFYEEFLQRYDPDQRRDLGTYYTPVPVVRFMVRAVDEIIKTEFGLPLGVADQTTWGQYAKKHKIAIPEGLTAGDKVIRMIDPATGTGTYLLEWLRQAEVNLKDAGTYGPQAMAEVINQMDAFEISLSSYAVAHLKTSLQLPEGLRNTAHLGIRLTDTLTRRGAKQLDLYQDDPIAEEGQAAEAIKFGTRHSVVIGNPPYDRVDRASGGGWIAHPGDGSRSLFEDIHEPARQHTIFSHQASLLNLYVYFWRWALWKTMEQLTAGPSVCCFITPRSYLAGPGFLGLRQLFREVADAVYIVDLGGDNLGARGDENVFPIQNAVCIGIAVRHPKPGDQCEVRYAQLLGSREHKLEILDQSTIQGFTWEFGPSEPRSAFRPPTGGAEWGTYPRLIDMFPWQQPGCMWNRTWPVAPSRDALKRRWERLLSSQDLEDRALCFFTSSSGRNISTRLAGLTPISELPEGAPSNPIVRFAHRSFDRQWAFADARLAKTESPSLWASISPEQVFLTTLTTTPLGKGPGATITPYTPDKHFFRGSYGGKDVVPLLRDSGGTANADPAFMASVAIGLGLDPAGLSPARLMSYCFGVLAGADYTSRFREELETPGPRIPLTSDPELFEAMAEHGEQLIWLQTYGERFRKQAREDLTVSEEIRWSNEPTRIPEDNRDYRYDPDSETLNVADGALQGLVQEVWDFEVSGMQVIKKWLGYRTAKGAGRAASSSSPLDQIRPTDWEPEWSEELREVVHVLTETNKLLPAGSKLLDQILDGELISADELPEPPEALRKPPTVASEDGGLLE
jgi:predicted helicase